MNRPFSPSNQLPTKMGILLRAFFDKIEKDRIQYCVLRNHELLPDYTTNDVDLLVEKNKIESSIAILLGIAKEQGWRLIRVNRRLGICKIFLFWPSKNDPQIDIVKIDLLSESLWRGVPTVDTSFVLCNTFRYRYFNVATPGSAAAVSLAKEYLQYGWFGDKDKAERNKRNYKSAVATDCEAFLRTLEPHFGRHCATEFARKIIEEDWNWFKKNYRQMQRHVIAKSIRKQPAQQLKNWYLYVVSHVKDKLKFPVGTMISFLGPDGSGKTSISMSLQLNIQTQMGKAFPVILYRHGRYGFLPDLKAIYNKLVGFTGVPPKKTTTVRESTQIDAPPFHLLQACFYLAYYTVDYLLGHLWLKWMRALGYVVIFDRYYYDYLIHGAYSYIPNSLRWGLLSLIPHPQLLFYLKGNPDAINSRKPELRPDQISAQQVICSQIIDRSVNGKICDVDVSMTDTLSCVMDNLLDHWEDSCLIKLASYRGHSDAELK